MAKKPTNKQRRASSKAGSSNERFPGTNPGVWRRGGQALRRLWHRLLENHWVWLGLFVLLGAWMLAGHRMSFAPAVEVGSIAFGDFTAPRDLLVPDESATQQRRLEAREQVAPVVDFDFQIAQRRDRDLGALFADARDLLKAERDRTVLLPAEAGSKPASVEPASSLEETLQASTRLRLDGNQVALFKSAGFSEALERDVRSLFERVFQRGIVADKSVLFDYEGLGVSVRYLGFDTEETQPNVSMYLDSEQELAEEVGSIVAEWSGFSVRERKVLARFAIENLQANVVPNLSETQRRRQASEDETQAVFSEIRKGQVIVRKGDVVTADQARVIALSARGSRAGGRWLPTLGFALVLAMMAVIVWLSLLNQPQGAKSRARLFSEVMILLITAVALGRFGFFLARAVGNSFQVGPYAQREAYLFAIPFASLALLLVLLYGRRFALLPSLLFALLAERLGAVEGGWLTLYAVAGSLAALYVTDYLHFKSRSVMLRAGLGIALVNVVAAVAVTAVADSDTSFQALGFRLLCALLGGVLCAAVASFAVSVFEGLFGITTHIKLIELSNTNLPLLRHLALDAPGTFHHSLMVGNLAKAGAEAVGADSLLAHVVSLYHDIGKMVRPDYFIENQVGRDNPHDSLAPSMSVLILSSHIKDGLELARQNQLPQPILDAIAQHHGTRRMGFFYDRALERAGEGDEVKEEDFRYPGPRPQDRVMGIIMLADGVEAASRTLNDASPAKVRSLIQRIVEDCLSDGQLDETDLTLADLRRVSDSFAQVLANQHHRRVDYPGFDFNAQPKKAQEPGRIAS